MNKPVSQSSHRLSNLIWRGVTLQLFLFVVLPLTVLVLIVTFGSLELHHEAMRSLVADRNLRAVQSAAASLEKEIGHRGKILELLSKRLGPAETVSSALISVEEDLSVFEGGVAVVTPDGSVVASVGSALIKKWIDTDDGTAMLNQASAAVPDTAEFFPAIAFDNQIYIPVLVRASTGEIITGLFSPHELLKEGLLTITGQEPVTVLVVDSNYNLLFREGSLGPQEDLSTHPGIQDALVGISGIAYFPTNLGEHVITFSPIRPVGWGLMIEESWEDIASPLLRATQNAPLIAIPILGMSLLALWFGLRQIVQPLQALEVKAADLARGNFETIQQPVGGVPEIRRLQGTLADMAVKLKEAQNSLHNYIGAITDSVENERRSLARELHDETLQSWIALGQYTQYASHWNKDAKVEKALSQVLDLTEQGMKNLRRLVQGLRPIYIEDLGLSTALAMQAKGNERPGGVRIHFLQDGLERRLRPETEMALYRITQEALNNVIRHANAKNVWISLNFRLEGVILDIRDDGQGFEVLSDPIQYARKGHYGLLGLYERSDLIGAKLTIRSSAGEGTQIIVRVSDRAEKVEKRE